MEDRHPKLTVIIPAYNEERRIGFMLGSYLPYLAAHYPDCVEVLVVINGTTDRTVEIVSSFLSSYPFLRCIVEPNPVGKGGALMLGFAAARGEIVGFVDADGATPPDAFDHLVLNLGDAGVILASRWHPKSRISPQPLSRRIASRLFNRAVRLLFDLPFSDTQCGAKVLRREVVQILLPHLGITQWAFDVDLLFQAKRAGFSILEVPTVWNDVTGSRLNVPRASLEMTMALIRLRLTYSRLRWIVTGYNRTLGRWLNFMRRDVA